jgi:hypothetical protein
MLLSSSVSPDGRFSPKLYLMHLTIHGGGEVTGGWVQI